MSISRFDEDSFLIETHGMSSDERRKYYQRSILDSYVMWNQRDKLREVDGYRLVATMNERPKGEFCYAYAFGEEVYGNDVPTILQTAYIQVEEFKAGDIITYWGKPIGKDALVIKHAGVYQGDERVISKFAEQGDLWEHPIGFNPKNVW